MDAMKTVGAAGETWREEGRWQLGFNHYDMLNVGMTGSAALGKLVVVHSSALQLTMFDLDAPLDGSAGRDIFRAHFAGVRRGYIQRMQARFLENDPRNLLAVAWSGIDRSGLELLDVVTGTVVDTLSTDIGRHFILSMAVTEGCIVVQGASCGSDKRRMVFRETRGLWHCALDTSLTAPHRMHSSLSFQSARAHEPGCLQELDSRADRKLYFSGAFPPRPVSAAGVDIVVTSVHHPVLVQTTGHDLVLALLESQLLKLKHAEDHVTATVVHTFESTSVLGATYMPGYGLLVLCQSQTQLMEACATLHHFVRTAMSPARCTWMQACVQHHTQ